MSDIDYDVPDNKSEPELDNEELVDEDEAEAEELGEQQQPNVEQQMDEKYGARNDAHGLRPRRPRDYGHLHTVLEHTVLTQHNMRKGIELFGDDGVNAVLKELKQLHDRQVFETKDPS
jgi:hypothetical protein